jgi:ATP-dependent Clp protease protease subunit
MMKKEEVEEQEELTAGISDVMSSLMGAEGDSLDKYGVMTLMADINSETVKPVIEWILKNNFSSSQFDKLTLIINSGGGSVTDAFALIDTMKGSGVPVRTVGLGEISSAALMIFMAGEVGHRSLTPNTSILSHQYSWGKWGKEHELVTANKAFDLTSKQITDHYMKCTGMTEKKVREFLLPPHDVWLSAKEAKKYGICDEIKSLY